MLEEVYQYLHDYGFNALNLDEIEKINENIYYANVSTVRKIITFMEDKYLEPDDIIDVINRNPFLLTEVNERLIALDNIYGSQLAIDYESLIKLIKDNPRTYTASPIELQKIINYLKDNNCSLSSIRKLVLNNPSIINMELDDLKKKLVLENNWEKWHKIIKVLRNAY